MKKCIKRIGEMIIVIPIVLLLVLLALILLPFDFFKYRRSLYWKRERRKYSLFAASSTAFEIYNEIAENALPIEYIKNPQQEHIVGDFFVYKGVLLVADDCSFDFDEETGHWTYCVEDEYEERTVMTLDEYAELSIKEANDAIGREVCNKVVTLINGENAGNIDGLENEPQFIVYKNKAERLKALKRFCEYGDA